MNAPPHERATASTSASGSHPSPPALVAASRDTTSLHVEIDEANEDPSGPEYPALRTYGHANNGRDVPQIVVRSRQRALSPIASGGAVSGGNSSGWGGSGNLRPSPHGQRKRTGLGPHPADARRLCPRRGRGGYVRRSGITIGDGTRRQTYIESVLRYEVPHAEQSGQRALGAGLRERQCRVVPELVIRESVGIERRDHDVDRVRTEFDIRGSAEPDQ